MKKLLKYFPLLYLIFYFNINASVLSEDIKIENIKAKVDGGALYIDYDLIGQKDEEYEVSVTMRRMGNINYVYIPQRSNLAGDIGEGKYAGLRKQIIWYYSKEMKKPADKDFYIEIRVKSIKSGISSFVWIGGGIAILGGAAAVLLSKKKGTDTPVEKFLPDSPDRP